MSYVFKIVVVGDYGVGKTTSIKKFVENKFREDYIPTLGVQITKKSIEINGNNVVLIIWDLAGQEEFFTVQRRFYNETEGVIIVYDITRKSSLENVKKWYKEVLKYTGRGIIWVLIGNKIDLIDKRIVNEDDVIKLLHENNIDVDIILETSAKNGENVEEAFYSLVTLLLEKY